MTYNAGYETVPGISSVDTTEEVDLTWFDTTRKNRYSGGLVSSAAADAGNTPTTTLRAGLLLGKVASTNQYKEWDPTASDGSEIVAGVLARAKDTLEEGSAANHFVGNILTHGYVKAARIIVPGAASAGLVGSNYEFIIRDQIAGRFVLDDIPNSLAPRFVNLTADKTITDAFHGSIITNVGAAADVTVTLPAPTRGFRCTLIQATDGVAGIDVATPSANQLILMDGTTAQTLAIASTVNKKMEIIGLSTSLYLAIVTPTTDTDT